VIGYYIHHHGRGHLSRATAIARELGEKVTGLSSLPRPDDWPGDWVHLPLDDATPPRDPEPSGRLHWVPLGSVGLRQRMSAISGWLGAHRPRVVVVDVSVEVCLLVRLHGVPVVTFTLPGHRADPAHELGFDVATTILGAWPREAAADIVTGLSARVMKRIIPVGGISRFAPSDDDARTDRIPRVLVLSGAGGGDFSALSIQEASRSTPDWEWAHLGGSSSTWVADPWQHLLAADVIVTHAGQNAVAEVAAARRPAVIIPQDRPHAEQRTTARVLDQGPWPAVVLDAVPDSGWSDILERTRRLDGSAWRAWNDGESAARAAHHIRRTAEIAEND
jgi:hypothetical protein